MLRSISPLLLAALSAGVPAPGVAQEGQSSGAAGKGDAPVERCMSFVDPANRRLCRADLTPVVVDGGALNPNSYCLPVTQQQANRINAGQAVRVRGIAGCSMRWN